MNLGSQRDLFEVPKDIVYLNCAYMSPQLRPAREIGERAVSRKSRPWEITPDDFFEDAEKVRTLFARLVGGDADGVAIVPSVSYGIAVPTITTGPVLCLRRSTPTLPSLPFRTATGPTARSLTSHASAQALGRRER